ncbi:hypothetical protein HGB25_00935 [Candidatus Saccharibacteria bacterium]|nr:hypothetical protein [Candidatus Saccharibacteria bacterium]
MERFDDKQMETMKSFGGLVLTKSGGEVVLTEEDNGNAILGHDAQLAVLDKAGNPYGAVDAALIETNPKNPFITRDDQDKTSLQIMSEAIHKASEAGLTSIAISADTIEEIEEVVGDIEDILLSDPNITRIGFYYPRLR